MAESMEEKWVQHLMCLDEVAKRNGAEWTRPAAKCLVMNGLNEPDELVGCTLNDLSKTDTDAVQPYIHICIYTFIYFYTVSLPGIDCNTMRINTGARRRACPSAAED
jgi:hypothetical protein